MERPLSRKLCTHTCIDGTLVFFPLVSVYTSFAKQSAAHPSLFCPQEHGYFRGRVGIAADRYQQRFSAFSHLVRLPGFKLDTDTSRKSVLETYVKQEWLNLPTSSFYDSLILPIPGCRSRPRANVRTLSRRMFALISSFAWSRI